MRRIFSGGSAKTWRCRLRPQKLWKADSQGKEMSTGCLSLSLALGMYVYHIYTYRLDYICVNTCVEIGCKFKSSVCTESEGVQRYQSSIINAFCFPPLASLHFVTSHSSASVSHCPTHTVPAWNGGPRANKTSNRLQPSPCLCLWFRLHRWHYLSILASRVVYRDEGNQDSKRTSSEQTTRSVWIGFTNNAVSVSLYSKSLVFELQIVFILNASVVF